jgi:hypothetical protein
MTHFSRASEEFGPKVEAEKFEKPRLLIDNCNPNKTVAGLRDILAAASTSRDTVGDAMKMRKRAARHAVNHLTRAIGQAIRSAGLAYQFSSNSYTAEALADVHALRNLMEIVAEHVAVAFAEDEQ